MVVAMGNDKQAVGGLCGGQWPCTLYVVSDLDKWATDLKMKGFVFMANSELSPNMALNSIELPWSTTTRFAWPRRTRSE